MKYDTTFTYTMDIAFNGEIITLHPVVSFAHDNETGGNGYYMKIENAELGYSNRFDCRHDKRLNPAKLNEYFKEFAHDIWTGKNGSAAVVSIKEV